MVKRYIIFLLFTAVCLVYLDLPAKETTEEASAEKCKSRIIASPILYYTPETRLAFGGAGSYIFQLGGCDNNTRPSSISPIVIYTLEKQFIGELKTELYFKNNDYRLVTEFIYWKYPHRFYGIGSRTLEENREDFTYRSTKLYLTFLKKIKEGFNFGFQYRFIDWRLTKMEAGGQLASGVIPGSEGGTLSGIGLVVNRDTRDTIFSPLRGDLFEFNVRVYPKFLGSTFEFTRFTLDLRKYFPLFSSHVFAVRSLAVMQTGTVPFLNLAQMGGPYVMRGYFEGRFRDKSLLVFQAEYRIPLFWRLGAVGFVGIGSVAEKFSQLDLGKLKSAYGIGLRFLFDKKERIQLRMDIGWGKNSSGFYFSIFEAF
ncbi:MAG: BamA/TamA family outer membrane protein [Candidatus Aminicenantes bacterium]|nr:BamA/TamA family outer membrane protein [Candidatus Aminicenantes bacterium]NIM80785.1 BamA/TamA family outer membrane protein [Candidatus Aminicenantes bacterium]NIN20168.1 BamA/TamA family outer membrane protein [Candidatus Aminicenantes bacterium]NIN43947.1 BamA/TamA family outer membrane protein [Candidatus Aminicenantes bacterium]NIN86756.1 BamA/TamA family outer membrane protein [Candidatus Aminicenantes bacterium]